MSVQRRNNVHIVGGGDATLVFAHGFGCDQNMWRFLAPYYATRYRTVLFDLVGSGQSDHAAYDRAKYGSLHGYADDLVEIVDEFGKGPVVFVGHSVSAMIGMLATIKAPERFAAQVMIGPSACYLNDGYYLGGFARRDLEELLARMEENYLEWSTAMAPLIMGSPNQPKLGKELTDSFCRSNPDIARHFARVTFLSDLRDEVRASNTPALILQCTDDLIAPRTAGEFLQRQLPRASLRMIENIGHCAHMSAPGACVREIDAYLAGVLR
ncbi:alpha/beta fold hydrolase [Massilia sp. AB1]|uniref:alpha/beta fold hydrolase n=1 Tax=Massilia sp. AB1 TaxID=2823371 RepID=UPI001B83A6F5|nr:alpha/beta hydrolase [Massilia sp. AB1]MBQ5941144.1 alpha/beta hydrolase [Massilia sp. AB1]